MKKFALLAAVAVLFVASDVAQAGVFRRGGGCPGGVCGVNLAAAPAPAPALAEKSEAPPAPATAPEVAATPAEGAPAAEAATETQTRVARGRLLSRRRG